MRGGRAFDEVFAEIYAKVPITKATPQQQHLFFLAAEQVLASKTDGSVRILGNRFWHAQLAHHMGKRLTVRFDPRAGVQVETSAERFVCNAPCVAAEGFLSQEAATKHARAKGAFEKASKNTLIAARTLTASEASTVLRDATPEGSSPPHAKVILAFFNKPKTTDDETMQREKFNETVSREHKKMHRARDEENLHEKTGNHSRPRWGGQNHHRRALCVCEKKLLGRGDDALVFNSHRQPEEHHAHACPHERVGGKGGGDVIFRMIVQRLQGTKGLLIIDEAQHLSLLALESLRSIHDATACGLVLMGNESVYANLSGRRSAEFAHLFSRVGMVLKLENPLPRTLRHWLGSGGSKKNPRQQSPPPKPRRWQGIRLFPFHGVKRTCSLAGGGAAPHDLLAQSARRGVGPRPTNPWRKQERGGRIKRPPSGHSAASGLDALKRRVGSTCTLGYLMFGFPHQTPSQWFTQRVRTAEGPHTQRVYNVKRHTLHVLKHAAVATKYAQGQLAPFLCRNTPSTWHIF